MKYLALLMGVCFFFFPFYAFSKVIHRVDITGHKTISETAVKAQLKTKKGRPLRETEVIKDVRRLYEMKYFDRISVRSKTRRGKLIVVFKVEEKPRISSITYKGNSALSQKKLEELSELKMYEFLNVKKLQKGMASIKKGYEEKGYFLPLISHQIKNRKNENKIDLIINIQEGKKALIQRVRFIGNHNMSDQMIKSFLLNKEKNFLSFITNAGVYKEENLHRDQQLVRFLYMEQGYMEAKVEEPQVTLSPSKDGIYISFSISEGKKFQVGQIDFSGDLIFSKLELRKLLSLKTGEVFKYSFLQKDLTALQIKYGDEGYAFANFIPRFAPQDQNIHLLFDIQKGEKVSINQINISGNSVTRDRVLRREMNFFEGDTYKASSILSARRSIQRLGYIESVEILNDPIDSNKVNLEVSVKEREMLGQIQAGPSYSTSTGLALNGEFSRENIFGLGVTMAVKANIITTLGAFETATPPPPKDNNQGAAPPSPKDSQKQSSYTPATFLSFQYIEPRLMDSDWYFGGNVFIEDTQATQCLVDSKFRGEPSGVSIQWSQKLKNIWDCVKNSGDSKIDKGDFNARAYLRPYFSEKTGVDLTFGRWLAGTSKVVAKLGVEYQLLSSKEQGIIEGFRLQEHSGVRNILGGSFEYDNRDDRLFPTKGLFSNISLDHIHKWRDSNHLIRFDGMISGYVSTQTLLSFLPLSYTPPPIMNFLSRVIWKNKLQYGRIQSLNQKSVPVDLLYLLGGPQSLRGYPYYSVGKSITVKGFKDPFPYGGSQQFLYNLEVQFPLLLKARLYGLAFFDMGYADDQLFTGWQTFFSSLRKNVGLGVMFMTPMGPIHLKLGLPLSENYKLNFQKTEFHFSMGADF